MSSIISYYFPGLSKKYGIRRGFTLENFASIFLNTLIKELKIGKVYNSIIINWQHAAFFVDGDAEMAYSHALVDAYGKYKDANWIVFGKFFSYITSFYDAFKDDISNLNNGNIEYITHIDDNAEFNYKCILEIITLEGKKCLCVNIFYKYLERPYVRVLQKVFNF